MSGDIDVLMITYRRSHYTQLSLERLLASCDDSMRVWLWHNGDDDATLEVVRSHLQHPRVHRFHHCPENQRLRTPTNWLWENAEGQYLSKVDDDCVLDLHWARTLRATHEANPKVGVLGCWRFQDEDFIPSLARRKIQELEQGHQILRNGWVQGSGYLMKRECREQLGLLRDGQSFTEYCRELAALGWVNGFSYPFVREDHMDDPRSPNSCLRTDEDLLRFAPISALNQGISGIEDWKSRVRRNAFAVQCAPFDPGAQVGWRGRWNRWRTRWLWQRWKSRNSW